MGAAAGDCPRTAPATCCPIWAACCPICMPTCAKSQPRCTRDPMRSKLNPPPLECRLLDALLAGDEVRAAVLLAGVLVRAAAVVPLGVLLVVPGVLAGLEVLPLELRGGVLLLELLGAAVPLALCTGLEAALLDAGRDAGAVDPVVS